MGLESIQAVETTGKSKVLIIGPTGSIGRHLANASVKLGHPTFALVRTTTPSDPAKLELLKSFQNAGITLLVGDVTDHKSLVAAFKQVDVVLSAISSDGDLLENEIKILDAAKEAGTIKRFLPSEYGNDVDKIEFDIPLTKTVFDNKQQARRAIEKSGIPYTFVVSSAFTSWYLASIVQEYNSGAPRDGTLLVLGDGNAKAIFNDDADIGTFTIKSIDDPRAANKTLHLRPKENIVSTNEVIALWEEKIGHTFEKKFLDKEAVLKSLRSSPNDFDLAIRYSLFLKGDNTSISLDPSKDVEATKLYPDVKYTTVDEYLTALAS